MGELWNVGWDWYIQGGDAVWKVLRYSWENPIYRA